MTTREHHVAVHSRQAVVALTDGRLLARAGDRVLLDVPVPGIRRIQLDVERGRQATLVVVPHDPAHPPQVLDVPDEELEPVARMVIMVGRALGQLD